MLKKLFMRLGGQDKIQPGCLGRKVTTVNRSDGGEKIVEQVLITAKSITKISQLLGVSRCNSFPFIWILTVLDSSKVFTVKIVVSSVPLMVGVYLSVINFFWADHNIWAGLGCLATSSAASCFLFRWVVWDDLDLVNGKSLAMIGVWLSVISVFSGSDIMKKGYGELREDLQWALMDASTTCSRNSDLVFKALNSCAVAPASDILDLNVQLAKAIHLNPTLSLVDGVYHSADNEKVDACLVNYYLVYKECPDSFILFNKKHPEVLLSTSR